MQQAKTDIDIGNGYALRLVDHGGCHVIKDGMAMHREDRKPPWFASIAKAIRFAMADWEVKRWEQRRAEALENGKEQDNARQNPSLSTEKTATGQS